MTSKNLITDLKKKKKKSMHNIKNIYIKNIREFWPEIYPLDTSHQYILLFLFYLILFYQYEILSLYL